MSPSTVRFRLPALSHLLGACSVLVGVILAFQMPDARSPDPHFRHLAHFISTTVHTAGLILGIAALLYIAWKEKSKALALRTVAVIGTETGLFLVLKGLTWWGFHTWSRPSGSDGGFPSGHTAVWVALAWLLTEQFGAAWSPIFYITAGAVAWSRVADGAHFPYQVAAGAVLGYVVAWTLSGRFVTAAPVVSTTGADTASAPPAAPR